MSSVFQAAKAITGGVIALKGQLIKAKGHAVVAKGKLLQTKGEAISNFGKTIATHAFDVHHEPQLDVQSGVSLYNHLPVTPIHQPTSKYTIIFLPRFVRYPSPHSIMPTMHASDLQATGLLLRLGTKDKCIRATRSRATRTRAVGDTRSYLVTRQGSECPRPGTVVALPSADTAQTATRQKEPRSRTRRNLVSIKCIMHVSVHEIRCLLAIVLFWFRYIIQCINQSFATRITRNPLYNL